ncbi:TetR/AcrR family transcriptional regulator [Serpentinicella alkaliphila]|nr:TetR/AcrR family transcriptional regulator [Serpentinicella alkaliphila]
MAKQVEIKKRSIFSHFKSKDEIFMEVLDQMIKKFEIYLDSIFIQFVLE